MNAKTDNGNNHSARLVRRFIIPAHDPSHGIDPANVAVTLDVGNWPKRAICRTDGDNHYYIYINQPLREDDTPNPEHYSIIIHNLYRYNLSGQKWRTHFSTLVEALAYANGQDNSDFSKYTHPAPTPPKSGPKPKSSIALAVEEAAKGLEKELNEEAHKKKQRE